MDISLPTIDEIESHINYWISYLQHYNINLNNLDKKYFSVLAIGTKRDQLKPSETKQRLERVEEIFQAKRQKQLISDWMIVSGKKKQQISALMTKINHFSREIVNNQSSFLPWTIRDIASSIESTINPPPTASSPSSSFAPLGTTMNNDLRFILTLDEIKQIPSLERFLQQPGDLELGLLLLHSIGAIVYQPQTQTVITNPTILIKMMASFVCPQTHLVIMFGETTTLRSIPKDGIFSIDEVYERVVGVLNKLGYSYSTDSNNSNNNNNNSTTTPTTTQISSTGIKQENQLIKAMEQFGFFYCLDEDEKKIYIKNRNDSSSITNDKNTSGGLDQYYLFPSLRENTGTFYLHQVRSSSPSHHFTLVVRYQRSPSNNITTTTTATKKNNFIPPYIFFHLQVCLRKQRDKVSEMWGNGMKLRSESNEAILLRSNQV